MKFFSLAIVASALSLLSSAAPLVTEDSAVIEKRAGPSGYLNYPSGGTTYDNKSGRGKITFSYQQVSQSNAQTLSIDVSLQTVAGGSGPVLPIAEDLASPSNTGTIVNTFALRGCGSWRLTIVERQLYNGQIIEFKSAAPIITINC